MTFYIDERPFPKFFFDDLKDAVKFIISRKLDSTRDLFPVSIKNRVELFIENCQFLPDAIDIIRFIEKSPNIKTLVIKSDSFKTSFLRDISNIFPQLSTLSLVQTNPKKRTFDSDENIFFYNLLSSTIIFLQVNGFPGYEFTKVTSMIRLAYINILNCNTSDDEIELFIENLRHNNTITSIVYDDFTESVNRVGFKFYKQMLNVLLENIWINNVSGYWARDIRLGNIYRLLIGRNRDIYYYVNTKMKERHDMGTGLGRGLTDLSKKTAAHFAF